MLFKGLLPRKKKLKASSFVIVGGLGLIFIFIVGFLFVQEFFKEFRLSSVDTYTEYRSDINNIAQTREEVRYLIKSEGAQAAYQQLKQQVVDESLEYQHDVAHIFGEELYQVTGLDGLAVCDHSLLNGCFHGFLLQAIAEQGIAIVPEIGKRCSFDQDIQLLSCHHGIGHGLGEYFGPERLDEQLEMCLTLAWKKPIRGCIGGVMMEYHFPSLIDESDKIIGVKFFDPKRPYDPCDQISDRFRLSCAYYIPRWWKSVTSHQRISELCQGFETADEQWYCFHGTGYITAHFTDFDVNQTKQLCDQMPNQEARVWCRMSAAWAFHTSPEQQDQQQWPELCQNLDGDEDLCIKEYDFDLVIPTLPDIKQ